MAWGVIAVLRRRHLQLQRKNQMSKKKSKWYEVVVTYSKTYAVEVRHDQSEADAIAAAESDFYQDCPEVTGAECRNELTDAESINRSKRHADEVLLLDES
jgi:hypothetical protein